MYEAVFMLHSEQKNVCVMYKIGLNVLFKSFKEDHQHKKDVEMGPSADYMHSTC